MSVAHNVQQMIESGTLFFGFHKLFYLQITIDIKRNAMIMKRNVFVLSVPILNILMKFN